MVNDAYFNGSYTAIGQSASTADTVLKDAVSKDAVNQTNTANKATGLVIDPVALVGCLPHFAYCDEVLHIDGVSVLSLAKQFGTPSYVYSSSAIIEAYRAYQTSFATIPHRICYAVKANSNLAILKLLSEEGAGFDIVSKGELLRVLQVTDGKKVVFSGVGKTADDIHAALLADIDCFNVEAISELDLINQVAGTLGRVANISLRINPDVDAMTHPYISTGLKDNKFGIDHRLALQAYEYAKQLPHLAIVGIDCHIGSQLLSAEPFVHALDRLIPLITALNDKGIVLKHIDIGGGLGVKYTDETPVTTQSYANALLPKLKALGLSVYLEPGRNMVANAGALLTTVNVLKPTPNKNFAVVDASMAELIRPALYQSVMAIIPARLPTPKALQSLDTACWDIVGAVCESGDRLGENRQLALAVGDVLAITGAGAYGFVMASNYNSRPKPCELLVDNGVAKVIRQRQSYDELWRGELW